MTGLATVKPRVVVVEDEKDLCDSMVEFLAAFGYPVWGVGSGEALYQRLAQDGADVLLLDVGLPGDDGIAIARQISLSGVASVILLSGNAGLAARTAGLAAGAERYMVKPVDLRELMANIDAVWRSRREAGK